MATPLRKNDIVELSDLEFMLKRGHIYFGSMKEGNYDTYIFEDDKLKFVNIPMVPAVDKIIAEIIDNSVDEYIRTKGQYANKISIEYNDGKITVTDNGRGLPIDKNSNGKWIPETIYTQLRTGSNFDDEGRATTGMNGTGSAGSAMLSTYFKIDTANGAKRYVQTFKHHLQTIEDPSITKSDKNYTTVEFIPNYDFFGMSPEALQYLPKLIEKKIIEHAFCRPDINFSFNKQKINAKSLKQFVTLIGDNFMFNESDKCRLAVSYSDSEFVQISFSNGLSTSRGGSHMDYVTNALVEAIRGFIRKKHKLEVKPIDIKSKLFIILSIHISNAQFDSQTKEYLTNPASDFKDIINEVLTEKFIKEILKNDEIMFPIVESYKMKQNIKEKQELKSALKKTPKIENYYPASEQTKYVVFSEGLAANGLCMSVLGRKEFSYFPLKGKPLNTLECSLSDIKKNKEMLSVIQILGLNLEKDEHVISHDNILFAFDQDADARHIMSLMLCLFQRYGKSLIKQGKIKYLRTPLIIGKQKGKVTKYFFNIEDYHKQLKDGDKTEYRYIKGLGSLKKDDLAYLIQKDGIDNFIQDFEYDEEYSVLLDSWMKKENTDNRKEFLRGNVMDINKL